MFTRRTTYMHMYRRYHNQDLLTQQTIFNNLINAQAKMVDKMQRHLHVVDHGILKS